MEERRNYEEIIKGSGERSIENVIMPILGSGEKNRKYENIKKGTEK